MKKRGKKAALRLISLLSVLTLTIGIIAVGIVPTAAYRAGDEIKGKTVCEVLGMDGAIYYRWMASHENDHYYLTTPYAPYDRRNPNGDCAGANGTGDKSGVPALNCMGFVWHALYMPTKMSGGRTGLIPAYARGGWFGLYTNNRVTRKYFSSKKAMLNSGYLEKGDIIWMYKYDEYTADDYNHIAIYWGDGHTDKVWHSVGAGCVFGKIRDYRLYCVLKVGAIPKLSTPKISSVTNMASGAKISWKKVPGATKYRVFVKTPTKWVTIGDSTTTSFVHKDAEPGVKYTYTVRCINNAATSYLSQYNTKGWSNTFYPAPGKLKAETKDGGILFSWNAAQGIHRYRVYRRLGEKDSWTAVAYAGDECSYYDTDVAYGKTYWYTARSVTEDNKNLSAFEPALKTQYLKTPRINSTSIGNSGLVLKWNKISKAAKYRVFYQKDGTWKKMADVTETTLTIKNPPDGEETLYTVRCLSAEEKAYTSYYDPVGTPVKYCKTPQLKRIEAVDEGIKLSWNASAGAEQYRVFRKTADSGYSAIAMTDATFFIDTNVENGTQYTYTVRCFDPASGTNISGFNSAGLSLSRVATPILRAQLNNGVVSFNWNAVRGASRYKVFMKIGEDGGWTTVLTTKTTSGEITIEPSEQPYYFTLRCVDQNGSFNSSYDPLGLQFVYEPVPEEPEPEDDDLLIQTGAPEAYEAFTE